MTSRYNVTVDSQAKTSSQITGLFLVSAIERMLKNEEYNSVRYDFLNKGWVSVFLSEKQYKWLSGQYDREASKLRGTPPAKVEIDGKAVGYWKVDEVDGRAKIFFQLDPTFCQSRLALAKTGIVIDPTCRMMSQRCKDLPVAYIIKGEDDSFERKANKIIVKNNVVCFVEEVVSPWSKRVDVIERWYFLADVTSIRPIRQSELAS